MEKIIYLLESIVFANIILILAIIFIIIKITQMKEKLMTALAALASISSSTETINVGVQGVSADVTDLKNQIQVLQEQAGLDPDTQAKLNELLSKAQEVESKAAAVATAISELDASTTQAVN